MRIRILENARGDVFPKITITNLTDKADCNNPFRIDEVRN
ncbi:hypothetical protein CBM2599_B20157 [Cupriavidus taiwanensis]|uniref:Uncharacterized protein n=1 Tax=Cupriavidus taiwanensis TaxID=164546 RepID=A0A9Q7UUV1_9BURK|nr:hypothetical protein CBM2599_B20157 [Cupriavidus taiwanensis]SPD66703.1 protein of unknown function [Cupriavidus taiwanensis]